GGGEGGAEGAWGWEKAWQQKAWPAEIGGRWRAFCSALPQRMIVGPIQFTFMYCEPRGSPRRHISSPRIAWRHGLASLPPYSRGQLRGSPPLSPRRGQNSPADAASPSLPRPALATS